MSVRFLSNESRMSLTAKCILELGAKCELRSQLHIFSGTDTLGPKVHGRIVRPHLVTFSARRISVHFGL